MSRNSSSCESVLEPKATEATLKPYTRHILSIDSGVQSHPKATLKPHQSHTKATPKPHQSQLLRLFQRLEGAATACSPRVLAIMRIAASHNPCHRRNHVIVRAICPIGSQTQRPV